MTSAVLRDRRLLVTGASAGIGRAIVELLTAAGAAVACAARRSDRLTKIAQATGAVPIQMDVRDGSQVQDGVDEAVSRLGGLDGLINNAGVLRVGAIATTPLEHWRLVFETNVIGVLAVTSAVIPHLQAAGGGDVVNVSSMSGRRIPSPDATVYSASKTALHTLSDGLRQQVHGDRIRVSIISPGVVDTELADALEDARARDALSRRQRDLGLDPRVVAEQVVHVLTQTADVNIVEVAVMPTRQAR